MSEERFARIEGRLDDLQQQVTTLGVELRSEMHALGSQLGSEMQTLGADLSHQMRLLHEHVVSQIASLAPDYQVIDRRIATAKGELREELLRRIEPLEAAERSRRRSNN